MVFGSIFGSLVNLVLVTETAKLTAKTIQSTADQARKPKRLGPSKPQPQRNNGLGITGQSSFNIKPINVNVQGILKDFKARKGLI